MTGCRRSGAPRMSAKSTFAGVPSVRSLPAQVRGLIQFPVLRIKIGYSRTS